MSLSPALRTALTEAVPPDTRVMLPALFDLLDAFLNPDTPPPALLPELLPIIQGLAGYAVGRDGSLIRFGSGSQIGDVTIEGSVVGGNQINLHVTLPPPTVAAAAQAEQSAPHLFLCYSRADAAAVEELSRALRRRGLWIWRDLEDLRLGRSSLRSIDDALAAVAGVLIYITPQSLRSPFIQQVELSAALARARSDARFPIIPVLDGVTIDELDAFSRTRRDDPRLTDFQLFTLPANPSERPAAIRTLAREALRTILPHNLKHAASRSAFTVEIFSRSPVVYDYPSDARVDWVESTQAGVPSLETWQKELHPALEDLVDAFQLVGRRPPIKLRPHAARLSVALAAGYVFRKTTGFNLWVEQTTGVLQWWRTDEQEQAPPPFVVTPFDHDPNGSDLTLEVTMTQPVGAAVTEWITATGASIRRRVQLQLGTGEISGSAQALAAARQIRAVIDQERARTPVPKQIHLFFAGPAALAALIGWHLNKVGPLLVYEYDSRGYASAIQVGMD
jgi:hypothetical protein